MPMGLVPFSVSIVRIINVYNNNNNNNSNNAAVSHKHTDTLKLINNIIYIHIYIYIYNEQQVNNNKHIFYIISIFQSCEALTLLDLVDTKLNTHKYDHVIMYVNNTCFIQN